MSETIHGTSSRQTIAVRSVVVCLLAVLPAAGCAPEPAVAAPAASAPSHVKLSALSGGFTGGLDDGDRFGTALAALGDMDGDGWSELAVGAIRDDDGGDGPDADKGAVWILELGADGTVRGHAKVSATAGAFAGALADEDRFGHGVVALGDVDGDGIPDLAVSAPLDDDGVVPGEAFEGRGAVWILFMERSGRVRDHVKISDTAGGMQGQLAGASFFGFGSAGLGDLDGNGVPDLAVQAHVVAPDSGRLRGVVFVLFLDRDGRVLSHTRVPAWGGAGFEGPVSDFDTFGYALASLGDLDGDGLPELAVGDPHDDDGGSAGAKSNVGAVWIVSLGNDGSVSRSVKIGAHSPGWEGVLRDGDLFGTSLAALGDLDGDGVGDLAVGAVPRREEPQRHNRSNVHILFLERDGSVKARATIPATGAGGFPGTGAVFDRFGHALAAPGDLDGDGVTELAVGLKDDADGGPLRGAVWLLFLQPDGTVRSP